MKRIGRFFCALFCLVPLLSGLLSTKAAGQSSVSVSASVSETTVYTGERINLSIKVSGSFNNVSRPELPDFPGFRLLSNTPSTSRSYSYVNGESSTSYTYSYYLVAQDKGDHTIPPISITIDNKDYQTDPIDVSIVDRNESAKSGSGQPDIFLQLEVSDKKPVTGQQIITDVILYFKDGLEVNSYQPVPGWKAEGFWKEELENSNRPQATSTIVNGVRYRKARLLQFALFPTKSGELTISPYNIIVSVRSVRSRGDAFSSFFGGFGSNQRQVELSSDPVTINAQPLPDAGNSQYLGAVGYYNISRSISTQDAKVGQSIELTTRIEGTGNVPLISKPEYDLPEGLEIYEPQENSNLNRRDGKISGSKTFTDVIIARSPGSYEIPAENISYFDPSKNRMVSVNLDPLSFNVEANPNANVASTSPGAQKISPVMGLATWVTPDTESLLGHWWFWTGLLIPLVVLSIGYWQKSYLTKMNTDRAFARSQKAYDKASQRLEETIHLSEEGHIKQAYNMLQKALTGFISDRLTLPEAGLSNQQYIQALKDQNIDENLVKNVRMLLDKCASISYAPDTSHEYLKSHVGLAESTLEKLKKVL